ncbi:MAG: hypothetical protein IID45_13105, partial [Planctomycetes bacterium]|nr:hypothetical protein [Planctomycetota bacterium]
TRPVVLDVFDPQSARLCAAESRLDLPTDLPVLAVGVDGTEGETDWQIETLKQELRAAVVGESINAETVRGESAQRLLQAMTEFPVGSDDPLTFQASVPPSAVIAFAELAQRAGVSVGIHAGNGIVNGHLSDESSTVEQAESVLMPLREFAIQRRGSLTILDCDDVWKERLGVFAGAEASRALMRRVKTALDPHGLLNPGRFIDRGDLPPAGPPHPVGNRSSS